jgi:hypothetical protein
VNRALVEEVMREAVKHGGNQAAKIKLALQMQRLGGFETVADAFAIYASWKGKRVVIDDMVWIPPIVEVESRDCH